MEPEEFLRVFREKKPAHRRTVIPTFPTVYALANITPDGTMYLRQVSTKFSLSADSKLLVVGPGTGVDTWIASFRTREPIWVVGINPLEVANTKATAKIAGFKVHAIVGDNVADEKGNLRFPGEKFDAALVAGGGARGRFHGLYLDPRGGGWVGRSAWCSVRRDLSRKRAPALFLRPEPPF